MAAKSDFFDLYRHGFVRVAVATPTVRIGDPAANAEGIAELMREAVREKALVCVFPELALSAYSCEDLFHQQALLEAVESAFALLLERTRNLPLATFVGLPVLVDGLLYNCAALICRGKLLGVAPKTYLPNYREFYELRQFTRGDVAIRNEVTLAGQKTPFGTDLLFRHLEQPKLALFAEICEDLWVPAPPSSFAALAGATLIANLSASNVVVGKHQYRRELASNQSARCIAAYLYSAAGSGESTTDLAWDGHAMVYENGALLAESNRFAAEGQLIIADLDLERLTQERMRMTSFNDSVSDHRDRVRSLRHVRVEFDVPAGPVPLRRAVDRFPYVPSDPTARGERCAEAYNIQVHGLTKRLAATGIQKVVIGVSGG